MAFPTIQTADTKNGVQTSNSSSWTLTYPTNIASGNLLLAFVATDGNTAAGTTWPAGWSPRVQQASTCTIHIAAKIATGSETGTFTLSLPAAEQGGWRIFRITEWYGGTLTSNIVDSDGIDIEISSDSSGSNAAPNPPSLDPTGWGTEDTLWFAACGVDTSRTISVYPLAGNNTADVSGGSTGATLGVCTTTSTVGSLDPGTFTISANDEWAVATVAVRPAAPAETSPPRPTIVSQAVNRSAVR